MTALTGHCTVQLNDVDCFFVYSLMTILCVYAVNSKSCQVTQPGVLIELIYLRVMLVKEYNLAVM